MICYPPSTRGDVKVGLGVGEVGVGRPAADLLASAARLPATPGFVEMNRCVKYEELFRRKYDQSGAKWSLIILRFIQYRDFQETTLQVNDFRQCTASMEAAPRPTPRIVIIAPS
jgi:hypothetical protein